MAPSHLIRLGRISAIISGILLIVSELLYLIVGLEFSADTATSNSFIAQSMLFLIAGVLLLGGLLGLYAGQTEILGLVGAAGFLVAFVGTALAAGSSWDTAFIVPAVAEEAPALLDAGLPPLALFGNVLSWGLLTIGWFLLGLAVLRARVYPRAAVILLMVGAVLAFFPLPFSIVPFGGALIWLGALSLSLDGEVSSEQPSRVR